MKLVSSINTRCGVTLAVLTGLVIVLGLPTPVRGQEAQIAPPAQTTPPETKSPPKPRRPFYVGPNVGVFLPTSGRTRSRFGSTWLDYGPGIGRIPGIKVRGAFSPDIHILSKANQGNRLFVVFLGIEYKRPLFFGMPRDHAPSDRGDTPQVHRPGLPFLPYYGLTVDLVGGDLHDPEDNIPAGTRFGVGGSAFVGLNFAEHAFIETRYRATSDIRSFDLSGLNVNVGYRIRF